MVWILISRRYATPIEEDGILDAYGVPGPRFLVQLRTSQKLRLTERNPGDHRAPAG